MTRHSGTVPLFTGLLVGMLWLPASAAEAARPKPATPPASAGATSADKGLQDKAPPAERARLIVVDINTVDEAVTGSARTGLQNALVLECQRTSALDVVSIAELRAAMKLEADRQELGCDDVSCAAEIADAYGARYVMFSALTRLGSMWTLTTSLYDSQQTRIIGRGAARSQTVPALAEGVPHAVFDTLGSLAARRAPPPSMSGTQEKGRSDGKQAAVSAPPVDVDEVPLLEEPLGPYDARSCVYDVEQDAWGCGGVSIPVVVARSGSMATAGSVRFSVDVSRGCPSEAVVEIDGGDQGASVLWQDAAAQYGSVAVPLKPASGVTIGVRIPPRAKARETLLIAGGCLGPGDLEATGRPDLASITVPFIVDEKPARATWVRRRAWEQKSEKELLAVVPAPPLPAPPAERVGERPGWPLTWTGAALGALAGAGIGAAAWFLMPPSSTIEQRILVGVGYGGVGLVCLGTPCTLAGGLADFGRNVDHDKKAEDGAVYVEALKSRAAWQRRLRDP